MADAYVLVKWAHILFAIVAVGFNASYAVLLARASREPQHLGHVLRSVKTLDDYGANPAYALLLVSGLAMVWLTDWALLGAFWIQASLVLYAVVAVAGIALYSPTLRAQMRALERGGHATDEYARLARRGTALGIVIGVLVVVIVFLMVVKPGAPW